jgi:hypothetical protein
MMETETGHSSGMVVVDDSFYSIGIKSHTRMHSASLVLVPRQTQRGIKSWSRRGPDHLTFVS